MDAHLSPLMPTQVARVTAVSAPAVTFMTANLMDQAFTGVFLFLWTDCITGAYVGDLCTSNQTVFYILHGNGGPLKNQLKFYGVCFS